MVCQLITPSHFMSEVGLLVAKFVFISPYLFISMLYYNINDKIFILTAYIVSADK